MRRLLAICLLICLGIASIALVSGQASNPAPGPGANANQRPNTAFSANNAPEVGNGWREGRATFYDAPDYFQEAFAVRGNGSFGNILYGDCQYYSRPQGSTTVTYGDQQYNMDAVAGAATLNIDYPRSCGACYEMRCRNGLVIQEGTTPVRSSNGFNLQAIGPDTPDTKGRLFPGNPAADQGENYVRCNNDTSSIFVTITDSCPCTSPTANNTQWCCGPVEHFDLSFWAFERLAHPLYGTMMLDFRPVDCYTRQPFQTFTPAFLNETIYGNRVETGWSYNVYGSDANQFALPGAGVGGSNATCIAPRAQGGVTFTARNGSLSGYQPFASASSVSFALRNNDSSQTGVPSSLKFTIQNTEAEQYCGGDVIPGQTHQPTSTQDGYSLFSIPIADFGCNNPSLSQVDALGIQNVGTATTPFCLDNLVIAQSANNAVAGRKLKL